MRRLRSEIATVMTVLSIPFGIAAVFPYRALTFRGSAAARLGTEPVASFVTLDEKSEGAAIRAAKTAWRDEGAEPMRNSTLILNELPEEPKRPVLTIESRSRLPALPLVERDVSPFLPSRRAVAPVRIAPDESADLQTFSRKELLKID